MYKVIIDCFRSDSSIFSSFYQFMTLGSPSDSSNQKNTTPEDQQALQIAQVWINFIYHSLQMNFLSMALMITNAQFSKFSWYFTELCERFDVGAACDGKQISYIGFLAGIKNETPCINPHCIFVQIIFTKYAQWIEFDISLKPLLKHMEENLYFDSSGTDQGTYDGFTGARCSRGNGNNLLWRCCHIFSWIDVKSCSAK